MHQKIHLCIKFLQEASTPFVSFRVILSKLQVNNIYTKFVQNYAAGFSDFKLDWGFNL